AIFIAAISQWSETDGERTLVASLAFALATVVTVVSAGYSEIYRRPPGRVFLYSQAVFDLLLVTAVVHVTGGSSSPFPALYVLVIATASLLVPASGGLLVAALGLVLYFADVVVLLRPPELDGNAIWIPGPAVWLQICVIGLVALVVRSLSTQLRESGAGKDLLVAALERNRLRAEDILLNIR